MKSRLSFRRGVAETPQVRDVPPLPHPGGEFQHRIFRHAVEEKIGLRVDQDRAAHPVRPDVVMGDPPEACLDPAEDDGRRLLEMAADQVGIGDHRAVRTAVVDPPGREVVLPSSLPGGGAVRDHGIDAAARDAPEEPRLAETGDIIFRAHVRLGDDPHAVSGGEQPLADHGDADKGAVQVAVSADQDHVEPRPAEIPDLLRRGGDEHVLSSICTNRLFYPLQFPARSRDNPSVHLVHPVSFFSGHHVCIFFDFIRFRTGRGCRAPRQFFGDSGCDGPPYRGL